jgi:hypothetical protein
MLFALCTDAADTPCLAAIFPSVSPDLTVYRVDAREAEACDVALADVADVTDAAEVSVYATSELAT